MTKTLTSLVSSSLLFGLVACSTPKYDSQSKLEHTTQGSNLQVSSVSPEYLVQLRKKIDDFTQSPTYTRLTANPNKNSNNEREKTAFQMVQFRENLDKYINLNDLGENATPTQEVERKNTAIAAEKLYKEHWRRVNLHDPTTNSEIDFFYSKGLEYVIKTFNYKKPASNEQTNNIRRPQLAPRTGSGVLLEQYIKSPEVAKVYSLEGLSDLDKFEVGKYHEVVAQMLDIDAQKYPASIESYPHALEITNNMANGVFRNIILRNTLSAEALGVIKQEQTYITGIYKQRILDYSRGSLSGVNINDEIARRRAMRQQVEPSATPKKSDEERIKKLENKMREIRENRAKAVSN